MGKRKDVMSIGALSKETGIGIETIRYYERIGVLKPAARKSSGYRIFDDNSLRTLRFLKHAQELGFTLLEIKELLRLKANEKSRCNDIKAKAENHLRDVEKKIDQLNRIKLVLTDLIGQCREKRTGDNCPILACFDDYKYSSATGGESHENEQIRK